MQYIRKEKVSASKCDAAANLSLIGAIQTVQDNVCSFFGTLNVDGVTLRKKFNAMWVYTKNKTLFYHDLHWDEDYEVKCFLSSKSAAKIVVDTALISNGQVAVYSKIEVCMLDIQTQKIRRITPDIIPDNTMIQSSLEDFDFDKINIEEGNYTTNNIIVNSTNIDFCRHTNNVEYIRFVLSTYSVDDIINKRFKTFEINYVSQSKEGEELAVRRYDNAVGADFVILSGERIVVNSRITFQSN